MNHADFEKFWGHFLDWFFTHNSSPFTKEAIFGFLEGDEPPGCRVNRTEKSVVKNASGLPKCVENMQKWFGCGDFLKLLYSIKSIQFVYVIFFASKGIEQFSMLGWGREILTFQGAVFLSAQTLTFLLSQKSRNVNEVHILASIPIMAQKMFRLAFCCFYRWRRHFLAPSHANLPKWFWGDFCCFPFENFMFF